MADAGAHKIRHLLTTPNPTLRKRAAVAEKTMSQLISTKPGGAPPSTTSITELQHYYRRLGRQIKATHTGSRKAKRRVLRALGTLDSGFSMLVAGIHSGQNNRDAKTKFDTAHRRISRARHDLTRAAKRLA